MAIAYKSQGSGVSTETNGAALSPLCPAVVDAGDILIAHVYYEGTADTPSTPSNWTLLSGPHVIETTIARHWVYGMVAAGTEDGSAVAFGTAGGTNQRAARIYSFSGRVAGTIAQLVRGFAHISNVNDPTAPSVTTTKAGARAVLLVGQNDNNVFASFTGESGGDWVEAVAEYSANLTPGISLGIQTCQPTSNPGTVTGGTDNTTNDPAGVIGFEIRDDIVATSSTADPGSYSVTGSGATDIANRPSSADSGSYSVSGTATKDAIGSSAGAGSYSVSGSDTKDGIGSNAAPGSLAVTGAGATSTSARNVTSSADPGSYSVSGADANAVRTFLSTGGPGAYSVSGTEASGYRDVPSNADPGSLSVTGAQADAVRDVPSTGSPGSYSVSGVATKDGIGSDAGPGHYYFGGPEPTDVVTGLQHIVSVAGPGAYVVGDGYATGVVHHADDPAGEPDGGTSPAQQAAASVVLAFILQEPDPFDHLR